MPQAFYADFYFMPSFIEFVYATVLQLLNLKGLTSYSITDGGV